MIIANPTKEINYMQDENSGFTAERIEMLRQNIDLSDIPEITDMKDFVPRNPELLKQSPGCGQELGGKAGLRPKS